MREDLLREGRRIAAIVLPRLLVELAVQRRVNVPASTARAAPVAVLLDDPTSTTHERALVLAAVDERARQAGVRAGQTLAEASGFSARLDVIHLDVAKVRSALTAIADAALSFGPTVSVAEASFDTVWVDVTGTAHLFGGEEALRVEIEERLRTIGWSADVAIADGSEGGQRVRSRATRGSRSPSPSTAKALQRSRNSPSRRSSTTMRFSRSSCGSASLGRRPS